MHRFLYYIRMQNSTAPTYLHVSFVDLQLATTTQLYSLSSHIAYHTPFFRIERLTADLILHVRVYM